MGARCIISALPAYRPAGQAANGAGRQVTATAIFGSVGHLTWWQECDRGVVVFVFGLAAVRIAGRRVFGKWAALDIIVSIIVGSNLSRALTGQAPLWGTLAATALLMTLHWVIAQAAVRSASLARLVEGTPIELARGGHLDHAALRRHAVSRRDIDEALRQSGIDDIEATRRMVLEPSGKIAALKK